MRCPWSEVLVDFCGAGVMSANSVDLNWPRKRKHLSFIRHGNGRSCLRRGEFKIRELTASVNNGLHVAICIFERHGFHNNSIRQDSNDLEPSSLVQLEAAGKEINKTAVACIVNPIAPFLCPGANAMTIRVSGNLVQII